MKLENLVVLGRAAPMTIKDGRTTCCLVGYEPDFGLCRIYPTSPWSKKIRRWSVINARVVGGTENKKDWRRESFKIKDSKHLETFDEQIEYLGEYPKQERQNLLDKIGYTTINELNDEKHSLGLIKPNIEKIKIEEKNKKLVIRVTYRCLPKCKSKGPHRQQILEWGAHEWFRKNPNKKKQEVIDNLCLENKEWEKIFVVGNSYRAPRGFMIINVLRFKKQR